MKVSNEILLDCIIVLFCMNMVTLITIACWVLDIKRMLK